MLHKLLLSGLLFALAGLLTSCYQVPVPQGNSLTKEDVARIKPGMSSKQVLSTLGDPVLNNTFANHRMTYVYSYKKVGDSMQVKRVIICFNSNKVSKVKVEDDSLHGENKHQSGL